jgi:hypothetical protein
MVCTFLPVGGSSSSRKLTTSGTEVTAVAFVADEMVAAAALAAAPADATALMAVPAFSGLSVSAVSTSSTLEWTLPVGSVGTIAAILIILGILLCINACFWSKKNRGSDPATGCCNGCCTVGCCSFNGVQAWSFGTFVGAIAILATVFNLFNNADGFKNTIVGLVELLIEVVEAATNGNSFLSGFTDVIPGFVVDVLRDQIDQLQLIPVAVMVPGLLAAIWLLFAAIGSSVMCKNKRKGSYCFTKCFVLLSWVFLLLAFVFYLIFAAFALVVSFAASFAPVIDEQLSSIQVLCVAKPAELAQLVQDNQAVVDRLDAAGQDVASLQSTLTDVQFISQKLTTGCTLIQDFIQDLMNLFVPGLMCVVAIIFSYFNGCALCCSAGCCKSPSSGSAKVGISA